MDLTLYDTYWTFIDSFCSVLFCIGFHKILSSVNRKTFWETVSAYCYYSDFYLWHIIHCVIPPELFFIIRLFTYIFIYKTSIQKVIWHIPYYDNVTFMPRIPLKAPSMAASSCAISHLFFAVRSLSSVICPSAFAASEHGA